MDRNKTRGKEPTVLCVLEEAVAASVPVQPENGRNRTQCEENVPQTSSTASETQVAPMHYPLGSWERHLVEERLRALKQHEREQRLRAELDRECTFQPCVGASLTSSDSKRRSVEVLEQFSPERRCVPVFERLTRRAKERESRLALLAEEKKRREEEALQYAFHPRVNGQVDQRENTSMQVPNVPVEERLLHYGRSIEQAHRLLQEQRNQQEFDDIHRNMLKRRNRSGASKKQPGGDIADRSKQFLMEREAERALAQKALFEEHTFRPKVCATSDAIDRGRRCVAVKEVRDRGVTLYEQGMRRKQQQQQQVAEAQKRDNSNLHKPLTNPLTDEWIHHGEHRALFKKDFVQRQEVYQRVREEHQRHLASAIEESQRAVIPRVDQEMIERQVERLYSGAQEIRSEIKKRMEKQITARDCPFRPTLAPGTAYVIARANREEDVVKRLSKSIPRHRRASHEAIFSLQNKDDTKGDDEDDNDRENKGHRSAKIIHLEEAAEYYYRQKRALEEREMNLREQKQRLTMEELCACTFRPQTSTTKYIRRQSGKKIPSEENGVKKTGSKEEERDDPRLEARVCGVTSYLKRQAEAKRRREEQEAKHERLGRGLPCNGPSYTVITPFNLSSGRHSRIHSLSPRHVTLKTNNEEKEEDNDDKVRDYFNHGSHVDPQRSGGISLAAHRWS